VINCGDAAGSCKLAAYLLYGNKSGCDVAVKMLCQINASCEVAADML